VVMGALDDSREVRVRQHRANSGNGHH
jgi:hypothetical protein